MESAEFQNVACGRGSILRRRCDTLCTSGFTDDVMFSYHGTYRRTNAHGVVYSTPVAVGGAQTAVGRPAR